MTHKEQKKIKSSKLYPIAIFLVIVALITFYLQKKRDSEFGSLLNSKQTELENKQEIQKKWARSIELTGVPNFHKVSDDLYRGAQPSSEALTCAGMSSGPSIVCT